MHAYKVRYHTVLGLILLSGLATLSHAQNALGDGRSLEARLQTPTINPPQRSFSSELAFRESIVSGTAPAGLSFRGDALPSRFEFRGDLGEDALFAFRRDSLYSGLAGRGIRGTDALQYQFALTVGGRVPGSLAGQISYARTGDTERFGDHNQAFARDLTGRESGLHYATEPDQMLSSIEAGSSLIQPVRSISTYTANRGLQPTLVGILQNRMTQQTAGQTASPLLGVQVVPVDTLRQPASIPNFRAPESSETTDPLAELAEPAEQPKTAYELMLDRYRELSGPEEAPQADNTIPVWANDLVGVQRMLRGIPTQKLDPARPLPGAEEVLPTAPETPIGRVETNLNPYAETTPAPSASKAPAFDLEVLRRVREAGGMTETLVPTQLAEIDRYTAYMQSAQKMIAKERYFDAEEMYISAMTSRPRDVNASIGRAHAQLGAGLILSAGLNVRQLLVRNPEISGMRYAPDLLPSATRLDHITLTLRNGLESATSGDDCGLLLAYLGFQRGIEEDIRAGLDALEKHGDEADQRLVEMLRTVWLEIDTESTNETNETDQPPEGDD